MTSEDRIEPAGSQGFNVDGPQPERKNKYDIE